MRVKGEIAFWDDGKGFGFIVPESGGEQVFVHIKAFKGRGKRPEIGQSVSYELSSDARGRPCAVEVKRLRSIKVVFALALVVGVIMLGFVWALLSRIPNYIIVLYPVMSLITFAVYAKDKSAARKGKWRTPETTLHLLALLGGWPGGVLAQRVLRHKSQKVSFRIVFWITVVVNCAVLIWLLTPAGTLGLNSFLRDLFPS